jgi:hypothetical protein
MEVREGSPRSNLEAVTHQFYDEILRRASPTVIVQAAHLLNGSRS